MPRDPKLTTAVKSKLQKLEPTLKKCILTADVKTAKTIMTEIQSILKPMGYSSRLMQNKNYYYEVFLEDGQIQIARSGFLGIRQKVSIHSRMYLEATALLSICEIRSGHLDLSQKYIDEVIRKINDNIKSYKKRIEFHKSYLSRIDDEILLYSLKDSAEEIDTDEVHKLSVELVQNKSEDELFNIIGNCIPDKTIKLLGSTQQHNLLLIPIQERRFLPSPVLEKEKKTAGEKFNSAIKRIAWKALCDPDDEIHKMWSEGLNKVYDKAYITAALVSAFIKWQIGTTILVAATLALILKFGIRIFCEINMPESIMEKR